LKNQGAKSTQSPIPNIPLDPTQEKKNFEQAKAAAIKWLDACPPEVIRKFINRSGDLQVLTGWD
jgi:hypothetical protein